MANSRCVRVRVQWMDWKAPSAPTEGRYSTMARFVDEDLRREAWSVVLEDFVREGGEISACAGFLVEAAPWDRLKPGVTFEMMEGSRASARVQVL